MIHTQELHLEESIVFGKQTQPLERERAGPTGQSDADAQGLLGQLARFGLVGGLNTLVDLLILNGLLWLFPTNSTSLLLAFSALAYGLGAINSFLLNKYWTFRHRRKTTGQELARFTLTTLCGIAWSTVMLWLASDALRPLLGNAALWANASKVVAIGGTALISYIGMRLWVFVGKPQMMPDSHGRYNTLRVETESK